MEPIVNLEETPGKVVGRITPSALDYDRMVRQTERMFGRVPVPKGVFRFRTHQEADIWMNNHILQAALKKSREARSERT